MDKAALYGYSSIGCVAFKVAIEVVNLKTMARGE